MSHNSKIIKIATEFSDAVGARNINEGLFSGEEFLNKKLLDEYISAVNGNYKILIDLDDSEGYATSFLEEAFGGLARVYGSNEVLKVLVFKSNDEPLLIEEIKSYIRDANINKQ